MDEKNSQHDVIERVSRGAAAQEPSAAEPQSK